MPVIDYFVSLTQQLAAKLEATAGTVETLAAADVNIKPFKDFKYEPDYERFSNDEVADDMAVAPDFVASKKGRMTFGCIFKGAGVLGTEPAIGIYLEACGHKKQDVKQITIGSITVGDNAFKAGDVYSATGGKAGIIEADISGAGALRYIATGGGDLANGNVVTAGTDNSTATCSGASSTYAVKYTPLSFGTRTLTIQRGIKNFNGTSSQDFLERLRGCMGTGTISWAALDALRFQGTFYGAQDFAGAGSLFTGVDYETLSNANLPKLVNATIQLNGVTLAPSAIAFDFGANVILEADPSTNGGASGYLRARIADRQPKITIDPLRMKPGTLDDLGLLGDGSEVPVSIICGTTPNIVELSCLKAQVRSNQPGERNGLEAASIELAIVRNTLLDNEYAIYFR